MQDKFNKMKIWRDIKVAYVFQVIIGLGVMFFILSQVFRIPGGGDSDFNRGYDKGKELGYQYGFNAGQKDMQEWVATRMLLAGASCRAVQHITGMHDTDIPVMARELADMSDKQIIDIKNIRISKLNSLRELDLRGKGYSSLDSSWATNVAYESYKKREEEWKKQNENKPDEVVNLQKEVEELKSKLNSQATDEVQESDSQTNDDSNHAK